jgi:hypothetical protein
MEAQALGEEDRRSGLGGGMQGWLGRARARQQGLWCCRGGSAGAAIALLPGGGAGPRWESVRGQRAWHAAGSQSRVGAARRRPGLWPGLLQRHVPG